MSFSVNTNTAAMNANLNASNTNSTLDKSLTALSSGDKLSSAAYDASGLTIANGLSSQVAGLGQTIMNANESIGMYQIADGAMQGYSDNLDKIRVLTLKASNATMSDANRESIQKEIDGLMKASDSIANSTSYNGINLLNSAGDGSELPNIADVRTSSFIGEIDVTTEEGRVGALENIDKAMKDSGEIRSNIGASINGLASTIRNTSVTQINTAAAESQIRDVDFALESANFSKANLNALIGSFVQSQANAIAGNAVDLLK